MSLAPSARGILLDQAIANTNPINVEAAPAGGTTATFTIGADSTTVAYAFFSDCGSAGFLPLEDSAGTAITGTTTSGRSRKITFDAPGRTVRATLTPGAASGNIYCDFGQGLLR